MIFASRLEIEKRTAISILFIMLSFFLVFAGFDKIAAEKMRDMGIAGAFAVGAFYTLGATTPLSMVIILEMMIMGDPILIALAACLSASLVDYFLFSSIRNALEKSTIKIIAKFQKRINFLSSTAPVIGFFVFGLPLPDEIGLALMGFTKIEPIKLSVIIFFSKIITLSIFYMALS